MKNHTSQISLLISQIAHWKIYRYIKYQKGKLEELESNSKVRMLKNRKKPKNNAKTVERKTNQEKKSLKKY